MEQEINELSIPPDCQISACLISKTYLHSIHTKSWIMIIIKTTQFQNKSFHCLFKASKNKTEINIFIIKSYEKKYA